LAPLRRLCVSVHSRLIIPRQQFINPVDLVVCDAAEGIAEPCLWVDAVEFGGRNQCVDDGGGFAAPLRSNEHVVFATNSDAAYGAFGCVVVELKEPVIQISPIIASICVCSTCAVAMGRLCHSTPRADRRHSLRVRSGLVSTARADIQSATARVFFLRCEFPL
jgi:hypothetical protein